MDEAPTPATVLVHALLPHWESSDADVRTLELDTADQVTQPGPSLAEE